MTTPTPPRRRWLRFSLRTLLLFVLLIGSSATLWWNWGPWTPAFTIQEDGHLMYLETFGAFIVSRVQRPSSKKDVCIVRDSATGRECLSDLRARFQGVEPEFAFSTSGKYVVAHAPKRRSMLYITATQRMIELPDENRENEAFSFSEPDDRFLCLDTGVYRLPDLIKLETYTRTDRSEPEVPSDVFATDRWMLAHVYTDDQEKTTTLLVYAAESNAPVSKIQVPEDAFIFDTLIFKEKIACRCNNTELVFDLRSGKLLNEIPGTVTSKAADAPGNEYDTRQYLAVYDEPHKRGAIWQIEPEIKENRSYVSPEDPYEFVVGDRVVRCDNRDEGGLFVSDLKSGATIWHYPRTGVFSHNLVYAACNEPGAECILDAKNGEILFSLSENRWPKAMPHLSHPRWAYNGYEIEFLRDPSAFITKPGDLLDRDSVYATSKLPVVPPSNDPKDNQFTLWKLRRPLAWYGPAYLPEFWLTLVLGAGFLWSVWRDRKVLKP